MLWMKTEGSKILDLPSLIDLVFLLLIFFMATISLTAPGEKSPIPGKIENPLQLPEAAGERAIPESEVLTTLLIQITHEKEEDSSTPKRIYILEPNVTAGLTASQALDTVKAELDKVPPDSTHSAKIPGDFMRLSPDQFQNLRVCRLISEVIDRYRREHFFAPSAANVIEVRAARDTEFRLVNYIMTQCSSYDKLIPKIVFRVASVDSTRRRTSGGV